MQNDGQIRFEALRVGEAGRRAFILDNVLDEPAADAIHKRFEQLPVTLSDTDRPDTQHVRHLKHEFDAEEWASDPVLNLLSGCARRFLRERRMACGALYRVYANFNLHGDFQFAHEDGEGWTALAFINSQWDEDWGGEFLLYPQGDSSFAYSIAPSPGRMVIFDGMLRHRGGVPSKLCYDPRISLAIKFAPSTRRAQSEPAAPS